MPTLKQAGFLLVPAFVVILFCLYHFSAEQGVFHRPQISSTKQKLPAFSQPHGVPTIATSLSSLSTINFSNWTDDLYSWLSTINSSKCNEGEEWSMNFRYLDVKLVCKGNTKPCYVWYWDVANWTLIYTNKTMMADASIPTRFCPEPVQGERTARIIHSNGSVEFPGCTMKKYPCSTNMKLISAYYDKKLKMRINRSPCCRKQLIDITHHMGKVFDEYNVTYFLTGGAVISLVRDNGELIPYDTDTDASVDSSDVHKVEKALPALRKPGYIFKWHGGEKDRTYMVGCTNKPCLIGPGIAFYSLKDGLAKSLSARAHSIPADIAVPPIRGIFEGVEMSFPKEPVKYLDHEYGKGKWKTPRKCTKVDSVKCIA